MLSQELKNSFLSIVRLGIGHDSEFPTIIEDWHTIETLASEQGLSAILVDGIEQLPESLRPPKEILLQWIGEVLQNYESRYKRYQDATGSLAAFYNHRGFNMMVLKGYACSLDWPRPDHRPCGDIDIWQFGKQKESDELITKEKKLNVDASHHHHTVFEWDGFSVENHFDFINIHHHKSNVSFESILKELGRDDSHWVEVNGGKVYLPSPNLHALFLLKHLMMHFASEGITLRQVLDWGFFVENHSKEVDWKYVMEILERFGMKNMFNIINAICVGDLSFDVALFPTVQFDPMLKDKVLNEILTPEFSNTTPKELLKRIPFKIRRWKGSAWKHELCYKESLWSAFWSGVWSHLIKPSSI